MPSTRTTGYRGYANPPWNLVGRVLNRVRQQHATLVLIAPVWKSQPWYPSLLEVAIDFPVFLPIKRNLIFPTHPECVPDVMPQLANWLISGNSTKIRQFQKRSQSFSWHHGDKGFQGLTTHSFESGLAGAVNGTMIQFQDL